MTTPLALYVHVPFCVRRCHYCDFAVSRSAKPPIGAWLACLSEDIRQWEEETGAPSGRPLDTIFVGGGTPSLLGERGMEGLAALLSDRFRWSASDVEWTVEANPGSLGVGALRAWRDLGVTRVSIGVQSFDDAALRWLGRLHDADGAVAAIRRVREAGFADVSIDLLFGLPEGVRTSWERDVDRALELDVPHLSLYGLTAEPRTPLGRLVGLGRVALADEDRYGREYLVAASRLAGAGYRHYEVSNFGRPGRECRHNWHYWLDSDYLGLGPSAHARLGRERVWNVRDWAAYRRTAQRGGCLREGRERLDPAAERLERIWLGLRTARGLEIGTPGGVDPPGVLLERWRRAGWARVDGDRLRLTPEGWLRLDALATELDGLAPELEGLAPELEGLTTELAARNGARTAAGRVAEDGRTWKGNR
ncbi:MAG: radical SAM family heme chaperone HemW [Gemmatimonadota bacterium]|nr:radical SAM family heme chaperone HemW [Gemmatimonadota bacterium]